MLSAAILGSSSLVIVPDLLGLTAAQALTALSNLELLVGTTSTTTSGASSENNGQIASQSVASGTLVEKYTSVGYTTYSYSVGPPPPPPVDPPPPPPADCSNCIDDDAGYCTNIDTVTGYGDYYVYRYDPTGQCPSCTPRFYGRVLCQTPAPESSPPPPSSSTIYWTYCSGTTSVTGSHVVESGIYSSCSAQYAFLNGNGEISSGWVCNTSGVTAASCASPPPPPPSDPPPPSGGGGGTPPPPSGGCTPSCTDCDPYYPDTQTCIDYDCSTYINYCN